MDASVALRKAFPVEVVPEEHGRVDARVELHRGVHHAVVVKLPLNFLGKAVRTHRRKRTHNVVLLDVSVGALELRRTLLLGKRRRVVGVHVLKGDLPLLLLEGVDLLEFGSEILFYLFVLELLELDHVRVKGTAGAAAAVPALARPPHGVQLLVVLVHVRLELGGNLGAHLLVASQIRGNVFQNHLV